MSDLTKYLPKSGSDCLRLSASAGDPLEEWLLLHNSSNDSLVLISSQ